MQSTPLLSRSRDLMGMISTQWKEPHELTGREICSLDQIARQAPDLIELRIIQEDLKVKVKGRTADLT